MKLAPITALLSLVVATSAFAADAPKPAAPANAPHGLFDEADTNHDGALTKDEWRAFGDKRFAEMDLNHDGKVTKEEMKAFHAKQDAEWKERHDAFKAQQGGAAPQAK